MSLPLAGRRILVTRPAAQAGPLKALIAAQGGEAIACPLLEIREVDEPEAAIARQALARLVSNARDYAFAIFVSPNAVDHALALLPPGGAWPAVPVAAVGPGTVRQLAHHGIVNAFLPSARFDSEALLELPALQGERVAGRAVLLLRGNGGRELLAETLRARGARVDAVTCYRRSGAADFTALADGLLGDRLDALTVSSSEGLRHLLENLDGKALARLRRLPLFAPHARIAEAAVAAGLSHVVLTGPADTGIIESLCAHAWPPNERSR